MCSYLYWNLYKALLHQHELQFTLSDLFALYYVLQIACKNVEFVKTNGSFVSLQQSYVEKTVEKNKIRIY